MLYFPRPNLTPFRAPWKTDNFGYYNKPGWATKPPVPFGSKFRKDELRWAEDAFGGTRVRHAVRDDIFNRYPQGHAYSKYLRVSRRPRSLGNGGRSAYNSYIRTYRCRRCGRTNHSTSQCYAKTYIR